MADTTQPGSLQGTMTGSTVTPAPTLTPSQTPQTPTAPTGVPGTNSNPFALAQAMQALEGQVKTKNALTTQRNLLLKHLYDTPLTDDEKKQLDPTFLPGVNSNNRNEIDMSLRLISDELAGRNSTLDQSVQYLTTAYNNTLDKAETARQNAITNITTTLKDFMTQFQNQGYTPQDSVKAAVQYLEALYGPTYVQQLQQMGVDINGLAQSFGASPSSPGTPDNSGGSPFTMGSAPGSAASVNNVSGLKDASGKFIVYDSPQTSLAATEKDIKGKQTGNTKTGLGPNSTLEQFVNTWINGQPTRKKDQGYTADDIAKDLGVTPQTKIGQLDTHQLALAVAKHETGYDPSKATLAVSPRTDQIGPIPGPYDDILHDKPDATVKFFNSLSPNEQSNLHQLITGQSLISDIAAGMGGAAARQRLLGEAQRIEPGFSENVNKRRYNFQQSWFKPEGSPFKTRTSINTAMGHMAQAFKDFQAIGNETLQKYNSLANMFSKETGNEAVTNFEYDVTQLASEIASAYKNGTAPTDQETEKEFERLTANMSPAQGQGVFDRAAKLMSSKITSMAEEYKGAMGKYPTDPIVQDFALQELKDAGVDIKPILATLKKQGYDLSQYEGTVGDGGASIDNADAILQKYGITPDAQTPGPIRRAFRGIGKFLTGQ